MCPAEGENHLGAAATRRTIPRVRRERRPASRTCTPVLSQPSVLQQVSLELQYPRTNHARQARSEAAAEDWAFAAIRKIRRVALDNGYAETAPSKWAFRESFRRERWWSRRS